MLECLGLLVSRVAIVDGKVLWIDCVSMAGKRILTGLDVSHGRLVNIGLRKSSLLQVIHSINHFRLVHCLL